MTPQHRTIKNFAGIHACVEIFVKKNHNAPRMPFFASSKMFHVSSAFSPRDWSLGLQRCNLGRDNSVDGSPMVLPVPGEHPFVGDSFLKDYWTQVKIPKKSRALDSPWASTSRLRQPRNPIENRVESTHRFGGRTFTFHFLGIYLHGVDGSLKRLTNFVVAFLT